MFVIFNIIIPIFTLSFLIFFHELGHYLAARAMGVGIKEFAIGMGPKIFSFRKNKITYAIRAIPIGGFVNMIGEDEESDSALSLTKKPVWKRFVVSVAGSLMNILLGFIIMGILVAGAKGFYSTKILRFESGSISEQAGLQVGDKILKVNNKGINIYNDLAYALIRDGSEPVTITLERNGEKIKVPDVQFKVASESSRLYGVIDFKTEVIKNSFGEGIRQTVFQSFSTIDMVWSSFFDLITGKYKVNEMSGPVGVTQEIGKSVQEGKSNFLFLITIITMNLGIVNLLPLPALDGGRIVFLLIELIRRKPIKPEYEGYVHLAGMAALMLFMVFITYKDIVALIVGK